jgi:RNA polymerase sigma-70 factor (ECF subfamily)
VAVVVRCLTAQRVFGHLRGLNGLGRYGVFFHMLRLLAPTAVTQLPLRSMTQPELGDEALVRQARGGSRSAFEALVRRYQKPLYLLCFRYVRDHDTAADLAQRTFIRVMEKLDDLREDNTFRSWLFRIGANLSLNHLRDHARFVDEAAGGSGGPQEPSATADAETQLQRAELSVALRQAVAELPTKQRMTLELRVYEELPFKDIAVALETTEGAAKVNFHYAVRRLRDILGSSGAGKVGAK